MKQKLFCFGLGYSARNLIRHLKQQDTGWQFSGTCRRFSKNSGPENPMPDVDTHIFDGNKPMVTTAELLADVTHMLISIAPQDNIGDPVLRHHGTKISKLRNLKWLGYLSTTGIYGDRKGEWVDDETPPAPTSTRGQQRLEAEQAWLKIFHDHDVPVHIFRLGSIYGPGRGHLASLEAGKLRKIIKEGQYFSRIHVDDIAQVLMASLKSPHPGQSYNVVDDRPAPSPDVIDYICDLLGRPHLPPIDISDAEMSPLMKLFYSENKRVRNDRIKQELGLILKYPTYQEGFKALAQRFP